jgi:HlyD family secretion protein
MSGTSGTVLRKNNRKKWWWLPILLIAGVAGAAAVMLPREADQSAPAVLSSVAESPLGVGARGWIEPEDGVLKVAAPALFGRPSIINALRVKEGDSVRAGDILAILDGRSSLESIVRQNEAEIEVARRKLAQVKAGAKPADIDAQKMEVARWESEYESAESDLRRYQKLHENEVATVSDVDQRRFALERIRRTLDAERERLKSIAGIRKEDVDLAAAELDAAIAKIEYARREVEESVVRAPVSGTVLKIHAYPGEEAGPEGILELARTDRMYVIAEVYETDIIRVHAGHKVRISGELLPEPMEGTVTQIGGQVTRSELLPTDTASFADTRVIKVKIQLENGERVAGLINGKVNVVIQP